MTQDLDVRQTCSVETMVLQLTVSWTSKSPSECREEGGMATAAMKLKASGAAKRHMSSPLASSE